MEDKKVTIVRKDGIVYERRYVGDDLSHRVNIRFCEEDLEAIKLLATKTGKRYQSMMREIINNYVKNELAKLGE